MSSRTSLRDCWAQLSAVNWGSPGGREGRKERGREGLREREGGREGKRK